MKTKCLTLLAVAFCACADAGDKATNLVNTNDMTKTQEAISNTLSGALGSSWGTIRSIKECAWDPDLAPTERAQTTNCWDVQIKGITLGEERGRNHYITSLHVFITLDGKSLLRIDSADLSVTRDSFPSMSSQKEQMEKVRQKFVGLPSGRPKIAFSQAARKAIGLQSAKRVIAYYVLLSCPEFETNPRPVWIIHAWQMRPFSTIGGTQRDVPEGARNHMRTIVDAENGTFYGADTIPQPD